MKKIAVIFPGVGYHVDKPLLYYSRKIAAQNGYEIREVRYGNFPLYVTEGADHSLETGDVEKDLKNLQEIMKITEEYIKAVGYNWSDEGTNED